MLLLQGFFVLFSGHCFTVNLFHSQVVVVNVFVQYATNLEDSRIHIYQHPVPYNFLAIFQLFLANFFVFYITVLMDLTTKGLSLIHISEPTRH